MQKKDKDIRKKLKYDPVDGLLPEIRRFCGFPRHREHEPSPRGPGKKKKVVEEEWSMPEAQNCGFCSLGGDILCCDGCPASFHLACIGYEESDVPEGNFYCNRCKNMPEGVRLFPPEKCCSSTSPTHRIANENRRNWEAIRFQYDRLKVQDESTSQDDVSYGPLNDDEQFQHDFPDTNFLKALATGNPMEFTLPSEFLLDREFYPNDSLEERRPQITGETCVECNLKDSWSPMLKCDFCQLDWHQKCVSPPMINIPRMSYWMCSRHTESLIDSVLLGDEVTREDRTILSEKYKHQEDTDEAYLETFHRFCEVTEECRMIDECQDEKVGDLIFYAPEEQASTSFVPSVLKPKTTILRKGGRGKKKNDTRFFNKAFTLENIDEPMKTSRKMADDTELDNSDLDDGDRKRSQQFTEEELIMSVMPFDNNTRQEYLTQKMLGTDIDTASSFLQRHSSMVTRSNVFFRNFSEKELIKLLRQDLDPVETIRGGGAQSLECLQDRTIRKKIKADVELLVQLIGFGNDHIDRKFNSLQTEAFFRRSTPIPGASNVYSQRTLREVALNSQKEALEISEVYTYHAEPQNLENLVLLAYDISFGSLEFRDSYYVSSMTPWSKEPLFALVAKWNEENEPVIIKAETPTPTEPEIEPEIEPEAEPEIEPTPTETFVEEPASFQMSSEDSVATTPLAEPMEEESSVEKQLSPAAPICVYNNDTGPLELFENVVNTVADQMAMCDFSGIQRPDVYEKAESVYEAEGFFGENFCDFNADPRLTKSLSDLTECINWPLVQNALREFVRREIENPIHLEHSYCSLQYPDEFSDDDDSIEVASPSEEIRHLKNYDDEEQETRSNIPSEFQAPPPPPAEYENFSGPIVRKRGRPVGSKNRKEGEAVPKRKRNTVATGGRGRGRGGRPRGSKSARGRASGSVCSNEASSRRQSRTISSDAPDSAHEFSPAVASKSLQDEVDDVRLKYAKMVLAKDLDETKNEYFETRDNALENWPIDQWQSLNERCTAERLKSLIPYDPRYFLPTQRVYARLESDGKRLPIAIQRCLTKLGTARDCHVLTHKFTEDHCQFLADYHCDIIHEYHSGFFYLSTLSTESVIVNNNVVRRPQLTMLENAEQKISQNVPHRTHPNLKCHCQIQIDQMISKQHNSGEMVRSGVVRLENGASIRMGCAVFRFWIVQ